MYAENGGRIRAELSTLLRQHRVRITSGDHVKPGHAAKMNIGAGSGWQRFPRIAGGQAGLRHLHNALGGPPAQLTQKRRLQGPEIMGNRVRQRRRQGAGQGLRRGHGITGGCPVISGAGIGWGGSAG